MVKRVEDNVLVDFIYLLTEQEQNSPKGVEDKDASNIWENVRSSKIYDWNSIKKFLKDEKYITIYAQRLKVGKKGLELINSTGLLIQEINDRVNERLQKIAEQEREREDESKRWHAAYDLYMDTLRRISKKVLDELNTRKGIVKFRIDTEHQDLQISGFLDASQDNFLNQEYYSPGAFGHPYLELNTKAIHQKLMELYSKYYKNKDDIPVFSVSGTNFYLDYMWLQKQVERLAKKD